MKKWVWAVAAVIVIAVVGGYAVAKHTESNHQYDQAIQDGKSALTDKNYTQAEKYFGKASRIKSNAPLATRLQNQTQKFVAGSSAVQNLQFAQAKTDFTTVTNVKDGSSVLVTRAKANLKTVKTVTKKRDSYTKMYKKALQLNQENAFTDSNGQLTVLFQAKPFKQSYYRDIYKQAVALRKQNNAALRASGTPSDSTPDSGSSSIATIDGASEEPSSKADSSSSSSKNSKTAKHSNATSSSKATLNSSEKQAAKNYSGSNEYTVTKKQKELNGKEITANQIKSARLDLNDAGVDAGALSDQDIRGLIQKASKEHTSVPAAAKQLLK